MRVRLDEEALKTIANLTHGEYFYAGTAHRPEEDLQEPQHQAVLREEGDRDHRAVRGRGGGLALLSALLSLLWFNRIL